jgi:hypothetical protein
LGVNDDTLAGEGEEGFEDIVPEVGGRLLEIIQKEGRRSIWMMDKRKSELADAVEPIGMGDTLDIEFLTDVRMRAKCSCGVVELIEDDAVVNASDAGFALGNRARRRNAAAVRRALFKVLPREPGRSRAGAGRLL